ncbi:hypothetical protein BY996DRAFT_6520919 [Phakopsora pachyrhizi]|nr:hypothetical protein BY996DRAFT_6520919 [Phakopsora pachyrhizi]
MVISWPVTWLLEPLPQKEVGPTRVATVKENYQKRKQAGLGRVGTAGRERVDIARPTTQGISQGRRRKGSGGLYGGRAGDARIRFGGTKIVQRIRKPWEGKRPAGGRRYKRGDRKEGKGRIAYIEYCIIQAGKGREVSVGLVRRRETPHQRRTDIWGISKAVVGRAVLSDFDIGARRRHAEVRPSYHFRVRAKKMAGRMDR